MTEEYLYNITKKLSFNRPAGSEECRRAADIIESEVSSFGGKVTRESFNFDYFAVDRAYFCVTEPYLKVYQAAGVGLSGDIDGEFGFSYIERATDYDIEQAKKSGNNPDGSVVLINSMSGEQYEGAVKSGAAAFVTMAGKCWMSSGEVDFPPRRLGPKMKKAGTIPGFIISSADAVEMVEKGASRVRCELKQRETALECDNLVSVIPGTTCPDEYVILSAHYDSVDVGEGAYDNAAADAVLLELYRRFMADKPKRSMIFLWCCAEERGLKGSSAFVKAHPDIMAKAKFNLNFDLVGCAVGYDGAQVMGEDSLVEFVKNLADETHTSFSLVQDIASSDCNIFAGEGVAALNFYRYGEADIHSRNDTMLPITGRAIEKTVRFAELFLRAADKETLPFDTTVPENLLDKLKK